MAQIRAMFVGHGPSGLPADRVVNTWHFENGDAYADHGDAVVAALKKFYAGIGGAISGISAPIGSWLSAWVQRAAELRLYDLSTAIPRVPRIEPFDLSAARQSDGYAEEVAVCLSITSLAPPFSPRRRGRLYIGPLAVGAIAASSSTLPARPASALITDLVVSAIYMSDQVGGVDWAIRSTRPVQNFVGVGRGWVDNALDTQRRRGPDATTRTNWVTTVGI
jgi:hypothetical protein